MTEIDSELLRRLVKGHKRDGRCLYDPQAKAEIVRACMQPGVSVARIAMQAGINANLVRTWIGQTRDAEGIRRNQPAPDHDASAAFVALRLADQAPVVPAMLRLHVRLPNGVEFDLGEAGLDALLPVLHILGDMPCSVSTKR